MDIDLRKGLRKISESQAAAISAEVTLQAQRRLEASLAQATA